MTKRELLKSLGWPDELLDAVEAVAAELEDSDRLVPAGVDEVVVDQPARSTTTIEITNAQPAGTDQLLAS